MNKLNLSVLILLVSVNGFTQKRIRDEHIIHQQERMVFKQWNEDKFTPKSGFLGLNPLYWMTWGLHPNYPDNDLRPLGIFGPQTQRLSLVLAMQHTDNAYKLQSDTIAGTVASASLRNSSLLVDQDPLWMLYYRKEFQPLLSGGLELLVGISPAELLHLRSTGIYQWYLEEHQQLQERLSGLRETDMDRGSRIMTYHRLLSEYRSLNALWSSAKQRAKLYLSLKNQASKIREGSIILKPRKRSDTEIADDILKNSKL